MAQLVALGTLFLALLSMAMLPQAYGNGARLYHFPLFSSSRVVQLILELGIPDVQIVPLSYNQMKEEPYLSLNPHGTVPAYQEGDFMLLESAAIMTYLCEKYDKSHSLLPVEPRSRAKYYQFAHYATATLYSKAGGLYVHAWEFRVGTPGEDKQSREVIEGSRQWLHKHFVPFFSRELGDKLYLLGDEFSAADIVMGWEVMLLGKIGFWGDFPKLQAYHDRLAERPSFQTVYPPEIHDVCIWPHDNPSCADLGGVHYNITDKPT